MVVVSILFGTLITVSDAIRVRVCEDCTTIYQCPQAMKLAASNRSQMTMDKLRNAICSIDKEMKICCSDFLDDQLVGTENVVNEIENHPNVHLLTNECGKITVSRLLGGRISSPYDFPWLVLIAIRSSRYVNFDCEGTLINSIYVLTTAHCIKNKHIFGVRVGGYNFRTTTDCFRQGDFRKCEAKYQDIDVSDIITHEDYGLHPFSLNDIGLLRLRRSVDFSVKTAGAICLPVFRNHRDMDLKGNRGTVASWNIVRDEIRSNSLLTTTIPILNAETCKSYFDRYDIFNTSSLVRQILCAGELGCDSCIEGEGSPLMLEGEYNDTYKYIQYGIQSHGPLQCGANAPGIYIDVRKFMKWILDSIQP